MTSRAIQCRDAVMTLLNADRPSSVPEAESSPIFPDVPLQGPRIAVYLDKEPANYSSNNRSAIVHRARMVIVQLAAVSETGADLDDQVEEMRVWVVAKLGNTDLNKLATSVEDKGVLEVRRVKLELVNICAYCLWEVRYQTKRDDMEAAQ